MYHYDCNSLMHTITHTHTLLHSHTSSLFSFFEVLGKRKVELFSRVVLCKPAAMLWLAEKGVGKSKAGEGEIWVVLWREKIKREDQVGVNDPFTVPENVNTNISLILLDPDERVHRSDCQRHRKA